MDIEKNYLKSAERKAEKNRLSDIIRNDACAFVFGAFGTGKTTLVREVLSDFQSIGQSVYIDCSLFRTENSILRELLLSLGIVISSKSNYDLIKRLKSKLKGKVVLGLDHFEHVKDTDILDIALGMGINVLIVSDTLDSYRCLSLPVKSKITNLMEIKDYPPEDIEVILKEYNNELSNDILQKIILRSDNLSQAVSVIRSLKTTPVKAQSQYLDQVFSKIVSSNLDLNEDMKLIIEVLKDRKKLPSKLLYELYCERALIPRCERAFRKYMHRLSSDGLVKAIGENRGRIYEFSGD